MIKVRVLTLDDDLLEEGQIDEFPFIIGRSAECDLHLDRHGVSRMHLEVACVPEGIVINDLQSTNGTFLHGQRMTQHRIQKTVKVRVGPFYLEFTELSTDVLKSFDSKADAATNIQALPPQAPKSAKPTALPENRPTALKKKDTPAVLNQLATRKEDPFELPQPRSNSGLDLEEARPTQTKTVRDIGVKEFSQSSVSLPSLVVAAGKSQFDESKSHAELKSQLPLDSQGDELSLQIADRVPPAPRPVQSAASSLRAASMNRAAHSHSFRSLEHWLDWKMGLALQVFPVGTAFLLEDLTYEILLAYLKIFVLSLVFAGLGSVIGRARRGDWEFKPYFMLGFYGFSMAVPGESLVQIYHSANPGEHSVYLGLGIFEAVICGALLVLLMQWSLLLARKGIAATLLPAFGLVAALMLPVMRNCDPKNLSSSPRLVGLVSASFSRQKLKSSDALIQTIDDDYSTLEIERSPASRR